MFKHFWQIARRLHGASAAAIGAERERFLKGALSAFQYAHGHAVSDYAKGACAWHHACVKAELARGPLDLWQIHSYFER